MFDTGNYRPYPEMDAQAIGKRPRGYIAPADLELGTVALQVASLQRSLEFYRDVLGMEVREEFEQEGRQALRLGAPGGERVLLELVEKPGVSRARDRGRLGLYHLALLLPDRAQLGRLLLHAHAAGARFGAADHFFSEALYFTDPDGIDVEVSADPTRDKWLVSPDGELLGTTDPLDVQGLAHAAGAERGNGMPAQTVMAHVHLYVGDVDQAEEFYHHGLGLSRVVWSFPSASFLAAGGYHHHVAVNTWAHGASPSGEDEARMLRWELLLDAPQAQEMAASLHKAGFAVEETAGGLEATDPWGITVLIRSQDRKSVV